MAMKTLSVAAAVYVGVNYHEKFTSVSKSQVYKRHLINPHRLYIFRLSEFTMHWGIAHEFLQEESIPN